MSDEPYDGYGGTLARKCQEGLAPEGRSELSPAHGWAAVCGDNMPPIDEIVWLWDGKKIWLGGRANEGDCWLWGNTYGSVWHNGTKWDGELETDDDYKPTHWLRLPEPPNGD